MNLSPLEDVESFYHFMMRCPADRSRAELYSNRRRVFLRVRFSEDHVHFSVEDKIYHD